MSHEYAEKEKAFLESLKADTGRDLAAWMNAISDQDLAHRNDIIDWLRHQGFIFARASWLERIHHNGGRPIYLPELPPDQPASQPLTRPSLRIVASNPDVVAPARNGAAAASTTITAVPAHGAPRAVTASHVPGAGSHLRAVASGPASGANASGAGLDQSNVNAVSKVVAKAKAFAPLARHVLNELPTAAPGVSLIASKNHVLFDGPRTFGALVVGPKHIKLCLDLGEVPIVEPIVMTRVPAPVARLPDSLSHMIVLDDARQIDEQLMALVSAAHQRVNG